MTKICHAHLYGTRDSKYDWLQGHDVLSTNWQEIKPQAPFYLLIPQNTDLLGEYQQGWKITETMPVNGWGIATRKDYLIIDFEFDSLLRKFKDILSIDILAAIEKYSIKNSPYWNFRDVKYKLSSNVQSHIKPVLFRPFDVRYIYYEKSMIERGDHRFDLMKNLFEENISLITVRRTEQLGDHQHFYCSNELSVLHSTSSKEGNFVFPLYTYPDRNEITQERRPNFSPEFLQDISTKLGYTPTPEAIFYYIYAIFHAPTYRRRYAEFLKIDFPRVPLTSNNELFQQLANYGEELVALHLMKSPKLDIPITQFEESGGNRIVDTGHPKYSNNKVTINKQGDGFIGVPEEVWNGSIPVMQKADYERSPLR
jgi:Type ISP C-terminal specificity domain